MNNFRCDFGGFCNGYLCGLHDSGKYTDSQQHLCIQNEKINKDVYIVLYKVRLEKWATSVLG